MKIVDIIFEDSPDRFPSYKVRLVDGDAEAVIEISNPRFGKTQFLGLSATTFHVDRFVPQLRVAGSEPTYVHDHVTLRERIGSTSASFYQTHGGKIFAADNLVTGVKPEVQLSLTKELYEILESNREEIVNRISSMGIQGSAYSVDSVKIDEAFSGLTSSLSTDEGISHALLANLPNIPDALRAIGAERVDALKGTVAGALDKFRSISPI